MCWRMKPLIKKFKKGEKIKLREKICAIVVTYNRKELLVECIEALLKQTYKLHEILIIDNASADQTYERILECKLLENPIISYKNTGANLGGAGGFNFGIKEAYQGKSNLFWIMDDDTIATDTALEELMKVYINVNDKKLGYLCSNVKWTDGNACNMNIPHKTDRWIDTVDKGYMEIIKCTFVSVLIKRNVVKRVGLPIKEFFIWGDDTEYTRRITLQGYKAYFAYNSIVVHKMASNSSPNIITDDSSRLDRHYYRYRNTVYIRIRKKYFGEEEVKRAKKKIWKDFKDIVLEVGYRDRGLRLKCIVRGIIAGYFFNPRIEKVK